MTDHSFSIQMIGLEAVLCQESQGKNHVIAYASRGLSGAERNYPAHKLEFLALKWAVTEKFSDYLYGHQFTVMTDNNPLTYVLTSAKLDSAGHRWQATLSEYDFELKYRPGSTNIDADILLRIPRDAEESQPKTDYKVLTRESVKAICSSMTVKPLVETICLSAGVVDDQILDDDTAVGVQDLRRAQRDDTDIGPVIRALSNGTRPRLDQFRPGSESHQLVRDWEKLKLRRGVLYRYVKMDGEDVHQIVLPRKYRQLALKGLHDDVGHQGRDRTLEGQVLLAQDDC